MVGLLHCFDGNNDAYGEDGDTSDEDEGIGSMVLCIINYVLHNVLILLILSTLQHCHSAEAEQGMSCFSFSLSRFLSHHTW